MALTTEKTTSPASTRRKSDVRSLRIGELLVQKGIITPEQLEEALKLQKQSGERLGRILIEKGWLTEDQLADVLSEKFNIPRVRVDSYTLDPSIVNTIPVELARRYKVIPLFRVEDTLTVAMADPLDIFAIDALRQATGLRIQEVIATESDIEKAIDRYYSTRDSMDQVVRDLGKEVETLDLEKNVDELSVKGAEDAAIVKLVNLILSQAVREGTSDIHIEPDEDIFRVRYRVDGILHEVLTPPKGLHPMVISRIKILADLDVSERRLPQDGRFRIHYDGRDIDVRVNTLPTVQGEKAVLRILDKGKGILRLEDMGFDQDTLLRFRESYRKSEGLVLITGPTGSGKTTTLYAVLNELNSPEKNIVTVENPVEYRLPRINQVQVNPAIGLTFAAGLRAILRQDPDIVLIGEIRDRETAEIAVRASLTGHLVLATLHTNDAPGAIPRLIDMGIDPFLVASSLQAVLAQRLVRRICSHCKIEVKPDPIVWSRFAPGYPYPEKPLARGKGCRECRKTGYKGRTGLYELLVVTDEIRQAILAGESGDEIARLARKYGLRKLREDGVRKVLEGVTTIDEVLRVT